MVTKRIAARKARGGSRFLEEQREREKNVAK